MPASRDRAEPPDDSESLLSRRPYVMFLAGRLCANLATNSQSVVIAWEVYAIARETMSLAEASFTVGMIGLVQFLPLFALSLIAGETADRHDRRHILTVCYASNLLISTGFAWRSMTGGGLWPIFALGGLFGCSRAFFMPTASALGPMLVPLHLLPRAIATNSLVAQLGQILGPALGGLLCAWSPTVGYVVSARCCMRGPRSVRSRSARTPGRGWRRGGHESHRSGRGLFTCGGTSWCSGPSRWTFLPCCWAERRVCCRCLRDVLKVGPHGFGILRASPAIGALLMAAYLARRPIRFRVGVKMFLAVGLFGLMTMVFAYSRWVPLSVIALAVLGGADMVSVFTRQSLVQIATPDPMRGRVSAVATLFIGASNELGEFESGSVARLLGPVGSVAFGGAGAMVVTAVWAWLFPSLRKADRLA